MKVLISCDYSPASEFVLQEAQKFLMAFNQPDVHVYSVIDIGVISATGLYNNTEVVKSMNEQAEEIGKWAQKIFTGTEVHFSTEVGYPAEMVVQKAINIGADLIILGTHGKTGISRMVIGSVAENVLRHTSCKTLIIPVKHVKNG